jgi:CheY-like chemotaxis protein
VQLSTRDRIKKETSARAPRRNILLAQRLLFISRRQPVMYFQRRILLIDDEPSLTAVVREALNATGRYLIKEENHSLRALHAARHFQPDLILLDVVMPDLDGREVARQIRDDPALQDVPIVFVTSLSQDGFIGSTGFLGGYSFVAKPFHISDLVDCVAEMLGDEATETNKSA